MAAPATESEPHATRDEEKISPSEHSKEEGVVASKSIDHEREKEIVNNERDTAGPIVKVDSYKDEKHINLTWRSWMVVFVTCFA